MARFRCTFLILFCLASCACGRVRAQDTSPPTAEQARAVLLRGKLADLQKRDEEIAALRKEVANTAATPDDQARARTRLEEAEKLQRTLTEGFRRDISGVGESAEDEISGEIDLTHEAKEVFKPMIEGLKNLTEQPRRMDELRREITRRERELARLRIAVEGLESTRATVEKDPDKAKNRPLLEHLSREKRETSQRIDDLGKETEVLRRQLQEVSKSPSVTARAAKEWSWFVLELLLHLLLAIAATAGMLFLLRLIWKTLRSRRILEKLRVSPFLARMCDVVFYTLSSVAAVFAGFSVLYLFGDWVLLTLGMLVVAGLVLVSRNTMPKFYDEAKLLLNVGAVREGERVLWRGLPWLVKKLHFYSEFENPALTGGRVRLPLRELVPLASRPLAAKERWFPCAEGDWVELLDGTVGKVVLQTPEQVQVAPPGGSFRTYPMAEFLEAAPRNLSQGFRITSILGLDYSHLPEIDSTIPAALEKELATALSALTGEDGLIRLHAELGHVGESSLNIAVLADFSGAAASHYTALPRLIQRTCALVARREGWRLPFRQVVVHAAEGVPAAGAEVRGAAAGD